jgi:hypothetical protein
MSKCRPEAPNNVLAIADFLRAVHINGKPLDLPDQIESIHTNPRNTLNMLRAMDVEELQTEARIFDITEAATDQINERIARLDKRLDSILSKLG